jgi:hypothetical protein
LPCFFPLRLGGTLQNPARSCQKGLKKMGRRQTEISYQSEAAYLKSVLLWLQECWTEPAPRYYPFGQIDQGLKRHSVSSARTGSDKQDVIMDIPAFLPPRKRYHL